MNVDLELESWRREWRSASAPLPDLKRRIRRQNARMGAAAALLVVCLAVSTTAALRGAGAFWSGLATGLWATALLVGTYAWWVRRGSWAPSADTTRAYLELAWRRAVAKERTLGFSVGMLLIAVALYGGFVALTPGHVSALSAAVLAALLLEVPLLTWLRRRNRHERDETRRLLDQTLEARDATPSAAGEERS